MAEASTLEGFQITRILDSDVETKYISILGSFEGLEGQAVVTLRRRPFDEATLPAVLSGSTKIDLQFQNDIYAKYTGTLPGQHNQINIDITHPATDKHISKAEAQEYIMAEADRLVFEDPDPECGFMLHPDMKWDEQRLESLYCIAIVHRRDVKSLRDLRSEHVPLLENIYCKGTLALRQRYGISSNMLRVFVHYQPSYYHFHVHFVHIKQDFGFGMAAGKAHLLLDIIDSLRVAPNLYKERTLNIVLGAKDPLLHAFEQAGRVSAPQTQESAHGQNSEQSTVQSDEPRKWQAL